MKICFFAKSTSQTTLLNTPYYRTDIAILERLGHQVVTAFDLEHLSYDCDVYYIWWYAAGFRALLVAKALGKPAIVVGPLAYLPVPALGYRAHPWYHRAVIRLSLKLADAVVGCSLADLAGFGALGARSPHIVRVATEANAMPLPYEQRQPLIMTVGQVTHSPGERKRLDKVIEAFKRVREAVPAARLVMVGAAGEGYDDLLELVKRLGLSEAVEFPGRLSVEARDDLYRRAMALVHPVIWEVLGLVPVEAISYGLPVVSSLAGVLREYLGEAGTYCDCTDPDKLALPLITLLANKELWNERSRSALLRSRRYTMERRQLVLDRLIRAVALRETPMAPIVPEQEPATEVSQAPAIERIA